MLVDKPQHSLLLPDLVVAALLPERFPPDRGRLQHESLKWLLQATHAALRTSSVTRCTRSLGSDKQALWECEVADSRQAAKWTASVLQSVIRSTTKHPGGESDTFYVDVTLPLMRSLVFRGNEEGLIQLLKTLRSELDQVLNQLTITRATTKTQALTEMAFFEYHDLPRHARAMVARTFARIPVHFGGMIYGCAFALALLRLGWAQWKTELCERMRIVTKGRA